MKSPLFLWSIYVTPHYKYNVDAGAAYLYLLYLLYALRHTIINPPWALARLLFRLPFLTPFVNF